MMQPNAMNPMTQIGFMDQRTTLINQMANLAQAYVQSGPMDENAARMAQVLRELQMLMTGGVAMPNGSIHGSVSMPNAPPPGMMDAPEETL